MNAAMLITVASIAIYECVSSSAEVTIHCDNYGTLQLSTDNGLTFETIATGNHWPTPITATLEDSQITDDTILRLSCRDAGVIGGVIATVIYNGYTYSTTEPIEDGLWELVSSTDGVTSPLVYHDKTSAPWNRNTAGIADDAKWIWNGKTGNTMVFDFQFANVNERAEVTIHCDNYGTLELSTDDGLTFTTIATGNHWPTPITATLEDSQITCDTILRLSCRDAGVIGGVIATVAYKGDIYSTTEPIEDGAWELVSSTDGVTSPLVYHEKTSAPWNRYTAGIADDAKWIWNGRTGNTMVFDFDFGDGLCVLGDIDFEYTSTETGCDGEQTEIGWVRYSQCEESAERGGSTMEYPTLPLTEIIDLAQYAVTVKILPKDDIPGQSETEEFAVTTCMCSNPIFALNNGYELSYELDLDTGLITAASQYEDNWLGSDEALDRLRNSCIRGGGIGGRIGGSPRDLSTGLIYQGCGRSGLRLRATTCMWEREEVMSPQQDVVVWLGFLASKFEKCDEYESVVIAETAKQPPVNELDADQYNENYIEVMISTQSVLYIFWIVIILIAINCGCLSYYGWNKNKGSAYYKVRTIDTEDESK